MTRGEHLEWAKKRALKYLDSGDVRQGFTSMLSDLNKHPELQNHKGGEIGLMFSSLRPGWVDDETEVRRWIVGFN
jgi:hypothetical protein